MSNASDVNNALMARARVMKGSMPCNRREKSCINQRINASVRLSSRSILISYQG